MRSLLTRTMYLGYYLKGTDRERLRHFVDHVCREQGGSRVSLYADVLRSVYRYNVSVLDYFYFRFYDQTAQERQAWAGTGHMYEYQRVMNPPGARMVLENKIRFLHHFARFVRRPFADLDSLRGDSGKAKGILDDPSGRVVIKDSSGQGGQGVRVLETTGLDAYGLVRLMQEGGYNLAEGYVTQHPDLMALSPSGLNTVRIITQLKHSGEVRILGARFRISVNSVVDNLAAGNLAAPVDLETGRVEGPAVYSDITRSDEVQHPITGVPIIGFQLPFWNETLEMVREAAQMVPDNRSIGWDVAVTRAGPELIEGNHNWCKLLWQLPVKRGLKSMLEP